MKIIFTIASLFLLQLLQARIIIVNPAGKVKTIRQAIEMASPGDTVQVMPGRYHEGSLQLTKTLSIIGISHPVLDGDHKYETLLISAKHVLIRGLQFENSGYSAMNDFASVKVVDASDVRIENNIINGAYFGIHISNTSYATVRNNIITGIPRSEQLSGNAIHCWKSRYALIENNQVQGHRDGIYFEFVTNSVIQHNLSENNIRYGLHFMFSNNDTYNDNTFRKNGAGVAVMYSHGVVMTFNLFEENWGASAYGILLKDISDSYIERNYFLKNTTGIHMEGSSRIQITHNRFSGNGWAIKVQASCESDNFHENNFIGNSFDVGTNGSLSLNDFSNNYWDKYEGYDLDRNGVGDVPFHPVSLYSMIVEENPPALMLFRSFTVQLIDKAEHAIPSLTPQNLIDASPRMKQLPL